MFVLSPWHLIIVGVALIVVIAVLLTPVLLITRAVRRRGSASGAGHTELVRINERLTSIEKVLKDIE
jgi:hypothetical protein